MGVDAKPDSKRRSIYDLLRRPADYPARRSAPERTIVVCTQQRSGSTLLGEAMYFAGGFGCPLEYFHDGFRPRFTQRWHAEGIGNYIAAVHRFRTDPSGTFGVKIFWQDVEALVQEIAPGREAYWPPLNAAQGADISYRRAFEAIEACIPKPIFIVLRRRDQVRQAVSLAVAGQTRRWRQLNSPASRPEIAYDFDAIVQHLAYLQNNDSHWRNFFRANSLSPHEVAYEDLEADYHGTLMRLFAALDRADAPVVPPRLQKQANSRSEELLQQFLTEFGEHVRRG